MRSRDIPGAPGGADAAYGVDAVHGPAGRGELADRLHGLPPGHPSAAWDEPDGLADQAAGRGDGESPERDDDPDPDRDPGDPAAAPQEPEARAGDRHAASPRPLGALGRGDPYHPWFAGPEAADLWFLTDGE
jgi:hypothetical protein